MFKKITILFLLFLLLVSCGDDSSNNTTNIGNTEGLMLEEKDDFSINVPETWEIIKDNESILPKPSRGTIELAVSSKTEKLGFKNNLLILSDKLNTFTTSKEFSMLNNVGASRDYLDYTLLESKDITFIDEEQGVLYTFEAKYNLDTPKLKFLQTAHICNQNKGFLLTIALPSSTKNTTKYEDLLKSFKCK